MQVLDTREYKLPSWAPYLIEYGNEGGFSEEDEKSIDEFLLWLNQEIKDEFGDRFHSCCWAYGEESYFSRSNDVNNLGANVIDCTLTIFAK